MGILKDQVLEEIELDPEEEEDYVIILDSREEHWRDAYEDNYYDRSKVHYLMWDLYMKDK